MARDSWIRFEGRTYRVPESRLVVSHDGDGLWLELHTGGEDDEVFESSGGLTINGLFVPRASSLDDLSDRTLTITPDAGEVELEDGFFWELGKTLEIEELHLRFRPRQVNLCPIELEARLLRHEGGGWRTLRAVGRLTAAVEEN